MDKKTFRVFTTRHYIAVDWFDIEAKTPAEAVRLAKKTAQKLKPDPRLEATDNHWQADEPVTIDRIGAFADGTHSMEEVAPGIFKVKHG